MSKTIVKNVLKAVNGIGYMATIEGSAPRVRPMSVSVTKDGTILTSTFTSSPKMKQLAKNPRVEIAFYDNEMNQVRLAGRIKVVTDRKVKEAFYKRTPAIKNYFTSASDPNFTLLELKPSQVLLMQAGAMAYAKVRW